MRNVFGITATLLLAAVFGVAQSSPPEIPALPEPDITGMYSFLHEGEFVQIEVNGSKVTGVISHYRNESPEAAEFEDCYFDTAKLAGNTLTFATKSTDALWYEFSGTVERGPAKTIEGEGYWIIRGTLTVHSKSKDSAAVQKTHKLDLRSFPQEALSAAPGDGKN
ncbi:MAG: hypothetical protein P4M01_07105 [Acidobacteriota bacterium]|nr:hypothetical protein [Acidobacteriota bacterium]